MSPRRWWPWRRRSSAHPSAEAVEALRQADRALVDAERVDCAARDVAAHLHDIRRRNHFTAAVLQAMRGNA